MSKKKKAVCSVAAAAALILAAVLALLLWGGPLRRSDFRRITSEEYDTVFLSMYPIDHYSESDFSHFREMTVFKAEHVLKNNFEIRRYMKRIAASGKSVSTVYLGVRPDKISVSRLSSLVQDYPGLTFEFILSYPSADYWRKLTGTQYTRVLENYQTFLAQASGLAEARFYFFAAEEWLVGNPALYEGDLLVTPGASTVIFCNSDYLHSYLVTPENAGLWSDSLKQLTGKLRASSPDACPDLSGTDLVFFGDSVFGNYNDDMSIPGVVRAFTGAAVYNCGYGGNSAAFVGDEDTPISLPGIVNAFFRRDLSPIPEDKQTWHGFTEYFNASHADRKTCYLINYGLNDYMKGYPISSEDPLDISTYTGAIRTAVAEIKEKSAGSQIILCTPTYSAYVLKESTDPAGLHLHAYADAVLALAEELDVDALDFFYSLGVDGDNYADYLLPDLIHPNEYSRYRIAVEKIIPMIR